MDWSAAIETNREALRRILTRLVAMAGLRGPFAPEAQGCPAGGAPTGGEDRDVDAASRYPEGMRSEERPTLPRQLHRAVLRLLRPAEAAARRLIIVMARDLSHPALRGQGPSLEGHPHAAPPASPKARKAARRATLPLFDPLPRWRGPRRPVAAGVPRISFPGDGASAPLPPRQPPMPDDPIDATRLALRLRAVAAALDDLPAHASRFARWRARRDAALKDQAQRQPAHRRGVTRRVWPLRPGRPPGWRPAGRHAHPVHDVLNIVHDLAFWAMERTDTS
ncbi:hypothetical protein [Neoaquamicrobium sediminum]|uniref:hypothetical protein n=2 Tax=Neoaquamicrobium sediminum TaxID=1849104 RepID=UPI00361BE220